MPNRWGAYPTIMGWYDTKQVMRALMSLGYERAAEDPESFATVVDAKPSDPAG